MKWAVALLLAAQTTQPILLDDERFRLSAEDVREISAVARDGGGASPWLITAGRVVPAGGAYAVAFLQPISERGSVRRGYVVRVVGRLSDDFKVVTSWTYSTFGEYVQLPVPGRSADDIRGREDLNMPFAVGYGLADEELVSLVAFVRAGTKWTEGDLQIESIRRGTIRDEYAPGVMVMIRKNRSESHILELQREGDSWIVIRYSTSVA